MLVLFLALRLNARPESRNLQGVKFLFGPKISKINDFSSNSLNRLIWFIQTQETISKLLKLAEALNTIRILAKSQPTTRVTKHNEVVHSTLSEEAKAHLKTKQQVSQNVNKLKRKISGIPKSPTSLSELFEKVVSFRNTDEDSQEDNFWSMMDSNLLHYSFTFREGYNDRAILIFCDEAGVGRLANAERWFCDGTFSVVPELFDQLWSIHTSEGEMDIGHPAMFALTTNRDIDTYSEIFQVLFSHFRNIPNFLPLSSTL